MPQSKTRPRGFAERVMMEWRETGQRAGLTEIETAVMAAQFAGLAVAEFTRTPDEMQQVLDTVTRAMNTACVGKNAVRQGHGYPARATSNH